MTMDGEIKREVAFAGQRVKQKVVFALALCSVIPRRAPRGAGGI
jgi:hypothetical protein